METVGAYEAKTHLPRLLEEVAGGRSFVITKHGVAVAMLVPAQHRHDDPTKVIEALRAARRGITLGDISVRELIEAGRR